MAKKKIRKLAKPKVAVIFDTNFLFTNAKQNLVSGNYLKFKKEFSNKLNLTLYIPQTVLDELIYQTTKTATSIFENMLKQNDLFHKITNFSSVANFKNDKIKQEVHKRFNEWITNESISVLPVPYTQISLKDTIDDSVWRRGVFEESRVSSSDETYNVKEKGFRDHIILKTIEYELAKIKGNKHIVFVSGDNLLRDEVQKLNSKKVIGASDQDSFSVLKSFADHAENITKQNLLPLATKAFFDQEKKQGLYYEKVKAKIENNFRSRIDGLAPEKNTGYDFSFLNNYDWVQDGGATYYIGNSGYLGKKDSTYRWYNTIQIDKVFKKVPRVNTLNQELTISGQPSGSTIGSSSGISLSDLAGLSSSSNILSSSPLSIGSNNSIATVPLTPFPEEKSTHSLLLRVEWQSKVNKYGHFSELKVLSVGEIEKDEDDLE